MDSEQLAELAADACDDRKAVDIQLIRVDEVSSLADWMVIAGGQSDVQVRAIARALGVSAELLAEERLVSCTVPLPDWVQEQLAGPRSAELLDLLVAEARRMRGPEWHQSSS